MLIRRLVTAATVIGLTVAAVILFQPNQTTSKSIRQPNMPSWFLSHYEWATVGNPHIVIKLTERVYIVLGKDNSCIASSTFVEEGCSSNTELLRHFVSAQCSPYLQSDRMEVFGLVRPSDHDLRAIWSDGTVESIGSINGFVSLIAFRHSHNYPKYIEGWTAIGEYFRIDSGSTPNWYKSCAKTNPSRARFQRLAGSFGTPPFGRIS